MAARPRSRFRSLRKRARRVAFSRPLAWLAARTVPPLYMAYMRLVWATSRFEEEGVDEMRRQIEGGSRFVALFWHEEVIGAPFAWSRYGITLHTLINVSAIGDVVTRIAERCGFVVFRGGSSHRRSRRRAGIVRSMIDHMNETESVVYGIPVDGSTGPPYRLKRGALVIARECRVPIVLARVWYRRCLRLPSWDRVALPLPFNRAQLYVRGPYAPPDPDASRDESERLRKQLEDDLIDLAAESCAVLGQRRPRNLVKAPSGEPVHGAA
jgi:lysophospholipid acyltransferase (LPLAT)-like uncharacterized protein